MDTLPPEIIWTLGTHLYFRCVIRLFKTCRRFYHFRNELLLNYYSADDNLLDIHNLDKYHERAELVPRICVRLQRKSLWERQSCAALQCAILYKARDIFSVLLPYVSFATAGRTLFVSTITECVVENDEISFFALMKTRAQSKRLKSYVLDRPLVFAAELNRPRMLRVLLSTTYGYAGLLMKLRRVCTRSKAVECLKIVDECYKRNL